jgi:Holliday junction resolvase
MGKINSRQKGKVGELELVQFLKRYGYDDARRGQQFKGSPDSPDIECESLAEYHIECKRVERLQIYSAIEQANGDSGESQIPVVFHRKNRESWLTVMYSSDFMEMVKELQELRAKVNAQETQAI